MNGVQLEELQRELGITISGLQTVHDAQGHPVTMLLPKGEEELDIADACKCIARNVFELKRIY